ncbi:MAG TPA: hypothetical protein VMO78_02465 [Rhizomicrobium sp.]|nr:hypothetical protein [Rhizomicrobium sp.]
MLRRARNLKNATDTERDRLRADAERLEDACVLLVFLGVALDAVVALASFLALLSPLGEKVAYLISNTAIAIGVYGVIRFGHVGGVILKLKLVEAIDHLGVLEIARASAEERAAQSKERTANLEARAAESEKQAHEMGLKAVETELKMQRLSSPRVPDQEKFLKALVGKPKPAKIDVMYAMEGSDCAILAAWTAKLLRDAGWPVDPEYPLVIPRSTDPALNSAESEGGQPWGITILEPEPKRSGSPTHALLNALFESLGSPLLAAVKTDRIQKGDLRIVVGPRP